MTAPPTTAGPWVERWLSAGRFNTYLNVAGGDRRMALGLYEWSAQMSAAIMHDLGHLEVAIRNAYNGALEARQPGPLHWTEDLARYFPRRQRRANNGTQIDLNDRPRRQVVDAIRAAGGPSARRGKVVAELTFGFCRYLTTRTHDATLWGAHHEPLLTADLTARRRDLVLVLDLINADLSQYIQRQSTWAAVEAERP